MVAGNDNLDYAVIKFDPAKVAPVANYNGFVIAGVGPDPAFGQIACKQGRTTGNSCGVTWGHGPGPRAPSSCRSAAGRVTPGRR